MIGRRKFAKTQLYANREGVPLNGEGMSVREMKEIFI
jgi:hypothetical protein